jgi:putative ABC transport system ATP-binding protein
MEQIKTNIETGGDILGDKAGITSGFNHSSKDSVVLKIQDVKKDFILRETEINILKGVSVDVQRGEFVMLMGPSGCGKSTLLHIVYGLENPTEGDVFVEGESIWSHTKSWRAFFRNQYVGFIPQQAFWIKSLSVIENVAIPGFIGGRGYRESVERAYKTLEVVGMEKWAHYRPFDLSGGQQQKVAFARALLLNPKFIIADEPTGNLDQKSGVQLMDLIKEFNEKYGITVLMVTHNPDQIKYAPRVVKMVDGKVFSDLTNKEDMDKIKEDA